MRNTRPPAVAGSFYPADERRLASMVDRYLAEATSTGKPADGVRALVVPHAGFIYSGPIAASAYALLRDLKPRPTRVAIFGPSHYVGFRGLALPESTALQTPLGTLDLDEEAVRAVSGLPQVFRAEQAHAREHSLEVQLPFLQRVLPDVKVTPFSVGEATREEVAQVMAALAKLPGMLLLVSTDLSHYLEWNDARAIDGQTAQSVLSLAPEEIESDQACGSVGLKGLLTFAKKERLLPELLDLRNSGDTAGDKERVVGYAAFAFRTAGGRT